MARWCANCGRERELHDGPFCRVVVVDDRTVRPDHAAYDSARDGGFKRKLERSNFYSFTRR